ncbi:hypothetical protein BDV25DRAFT_168491 [Aspergillus avenaceus]|uniref:6-methylsalicylic acid synthase n=1 Tax=Aspergillus avenaceus TaxID=36643 RepID=A0A5N6TPX5_ASPAV|nr:hypothetical protein BDV25DRAFT_168491 [Aspergillus avenaceus]
MDPNQGVEVMPSRTILPITRGKDSRRDVAIVGMGCRLPGSNNSPDELWQSILNQKVASGEIPDMRWESYRRNPQSMEYLDSVPRRGYFLNSLEGFDASFFGISPKEAEQMDPQQRLALEVTWEALENAGIAYQSISGSDTAVYMGVNSDDYRKLLLEDAANVEPWMGIGTAYCGVANRISHQFNLVGPSAAVDAACASSLVAIHMGRQAILNEESKIAIVGGVNALIVPGLTIILKKAGALSPDGLCRPFDDAADGYGRGEGAAVIILKNMADAIADSDHILAVLKGTAVAQDGHTEGIMAPNSKAQELVAQKALEVAGVDASTVEYVEAHATSTAVGDPAEISALAAVYGQERDSDKPCFVGSVKANVGHLEAGAGVVGFIKAVLSVQKGILAPQANLEVLNTKVDWHRGIQVVEEVTEWPSSGHPRRASVCSYGFGGTVSHAIIEQYDPTDVSASPRDNILKTSKVLLLSATRQKLLPIQASTQARWISTVGRQHDLACIASTLATRRSHHKYRAAFVVDDHDDAALQLDSFSNSGSIKWATMGRVPEKNDRPIVWVFSGHGAQWSGMAQDLLRYPVFRNVIESVDMIVREEMGFSAVNVMETGHLGDSVQVQVLTYLMQIGLSELLHSCGVSCNAIIGHSVGEIAASVVAGCITSAEGALIVTRRAKLYRQLMGVGAMVLVQLPSGQAKEQITSLGTNRLVVAIDSSPSSCVISGPKEDIYNISSVLKDKGVKTFRVDTDIAFHQTTHLTSAVSAAAEDGMNVFLEVSSHHIISHSIEEALLNLGVENFTVCNTMIREMPAEKAILSSMCQLHCQGAKVDWKQYIQGAWASGVPTTAWAHKAFFRRINPYCAETITRTHDPIKHTLIGHRTVVAGGDTAVYSTCVNSQTKPFPGRYLLYDYEYIPAAVLMNTFLHGTGARELHNFYLHAPIIVNQPREVQLVVQSNQSRLWTRLIEGHKSETDDDWFMHTTGDWTIGLEGQPVAGDINIERTKSRLDEVLKSSFSVDYLASVGVTSMAFPWVVTEHRGNLNEMIARVDVAPKGGGGGEAPLDHRSWAPILDAATSVASTLFFDKPRLRIPTHVKNLRVLVQRPPRRIGWLLINKATEHDLTAHVNICDETGTIVLQIISMKFAEIEEATGARGSIDSLVHHLAWPPAIYSEIALSFNNIILASRDESLASIYASSLTKESQMNIFLTSSNKLVEGTECRGLLARTDTIIAYVPEYIRGTDQIVSASQTFSFDLINIVKFISTLAHPVKIFVLTYRVFAAESPTALAQACLLGLSRIIASEAPDIWGALIDLEDPVFPMTVIRYIQHHDVVRIFDGVPRSARLHPLPRDKLLKPWKQKSLLPHPSGTYLITSGLGDLGLETASFLVERGARRVILVSRRSLPHRKEWVTFNNSSSPIAPMLQKIQSMESHGATVRIISLDIASPDAATQLQSHLNDLCFPPVRGVIHAAGVLESGYVLSAQKDSFQHVLTPKGAGSLTLNTLFPPNTLDFMVFYSSCGQHFGFPGQGSYAAANAFLDSLATHRRSQGDNTVAIQWTSWRGIGMTKGSEFVEAESAMKGITDITPNEAFAAWMQISKYDIDQAMVVRSRVLDQHQPLPSPLLADIAVRNHSPSPNPSSSTPEDSLESHSAQKSQLESLDKCVRECVADVLQMDVDEVVSHEPLSKMGIDSVMTIQLRGMLQRHMGIAIPPTLVWEHPTVDHISAWLKVKVGERV